MEFFKILIRRKDTVLTNAHSNTVKLDDFHLMNKCS